MAEILEFPFDSGAYEAADRKWLPPNLLSVAENVRLDRDGRLVVRPGATALSSATMSANTLTPFDLGTYQGRLVALGTQITVITDRMTDLFEYVPTALKWRSTSGADVDSSTGPRLPQLTDIREIGLLPDQGDSVRHVSLAAGGGYVCAVISRATESTVHVFDPATNQTLLLEDVALRLGRVVYAGSDFWVYGVDSDEDICRVNFDPSTDETLSSVTTLLSNATTVVDLSAHTFGTGSAVAWCTASSAEIRTYNSAGTSVTSWQAVNAQVDSVALVGNVAGTLLSLAYQDSSREYQLSTWNASGVLQNGPTALFAGAGGSGVRIGAGLASNGTSLHVMGMHETNGEGLYQVVIQSTHGLTTTDTYYDARPAMAPIAVSGTEFAGWQDQRASNRTLGTFHITGERRMPQCFLAHQLIDTQDTTANVVCNGCISGTKLYIPVVLMAENNGLVGQNLRFAIYEAETAATARRQMAEVGGELLIAGGLPLTYDGRTMSEIGFAECPVVTLESAIGTTGSLTTDSTYQAKAIWKVYNGRTLIARSQPSLPASASITGGVDLIVWRVTTPHSLRRHRAFEDQNLTVVVELYRTSANGAVFQLDAVAVVDPADSEAETVLVTSTQADTALADNAVLYSEESGMEIAAPYPCRYVWPARDRALTGGLPQEDNWFFSDLLIPGRQVSFPALFFQGSYMRRANQPITAVGAFETTSIIWTEDEILQVPGRGPERSGAGEFDSVIPVPTPGGCIDWRSLVLTPLGFFFQMDTDKLMLLTRGSGGGPGEVLWVGQPVRDTLASFPVITAAIHIRTQMAVVFACNNTAGTDGRLLVFDLRRQQWFIDDVGGPVTALAELDGRLVWLSGTTVSQQHAAAGSGTFVPATVQIGFQRVTKALGWGHIYRVGLLGEVLGACTVEAFIDYDDGAGLRSLGSLALDGSEGTLERFWSLTIQKCSRYSLRFEVTGSSNSAGLRLHGWAVEVQGSPGMVRVGSTGHVA